MPNIWLTPLQREVLSFFGNNSFGRNFYWTGGTLLSYAHFSHRFSVDLDFFSNDLFQDSQYIQFINELKKALRADKITETLQHNRRIYNIDRGKENVKLELVFFPFPSIEKPEKLDEFKIKADSLTDIMVNKTLSAYQRNEVKDGYDLYYYLSGNKPKYNLSELLKLEEKKFGVAIEATLFLAKINELINGLNLFKPLLLNPPKNLQKDMKSFFQKEFNNLAKKSIK